MWSLREAWVWAVGSAVATRRDALFSSNPGDESPGYGRKPLTRQRELPPSAQAEQRRAAEQQHGARGLGDSRDTKTHKARSRDWIVAAAFSSM